MLEKISKNERLPIMIEGEAKKRFIDLLNTLARDANSDDIFNDVHPLWIYCQAIDLTKRDDALTMPLSMWSEDYVDARFHATGFLDFSQKTDEAVKLDFYPSLKTNLAKSYLYFFKKVGPHIPSALVFRGWKYVRNCPLSGTMICLIDRYRTYKALLEGNHLEKTQLNGPDKKIFSRREMLQFVSDAVDIPLEQIEFITFSRKIHTLDSFEEEMNEVSEQTDEADEEPFDNIEIVEGAMVRVVKLIHLKKLQTIVREWNEAVLVSSRKFAGDWEDADALRQFILQREVLLCNAEYRAQILRFMSNEDEAPEIEVSESESSTAGD